MLQLPLPLRALCVFYFSLSASVQAADPQSPLSSQKNRRGYNKGELMPVSCLNRTIDTGEHVTDSHGNLQYIPFPTCNETQLPLAFPYDTPLTQSCTVDALPDELYHLIEFFVHSDVPLTCRVPTYPLDSAAATVDTALSTGVGSTSDVDTWTPFTVAVQGTLQTSHLHLHTNINVLFHTSIEEPSKKSKKQPQSHLIASTAYSVPNPSLSSPREGTKITRYEPLVLTFNVGWVDGDVLPGMVSRPMLAVKDHSVGFSLISLMGLAASAGFGALGMLLYERKKSGRAGAGMGNGLLGGNTGNGGVARSTGYGGYGGYGGYSSGTGKRD